MQREKQRIYSQESAGGLMIKMSEMYRISGGCRSDKMCRECMNYVDEKHPYCLVYPKEFNGDWDGSRIACKYYTDTVDDGQMDIRDYFKAKGGMKQ